MKKIIVFFLVLAVVVGGAWFYFNATSRPNVEANLPVDLSGQELLPWVEAHVPGVFVRKFEAVVNTPLKTGDELRAGDTIITDESGLATVHLPDGSMFRLDVDSEVTLADFTFQNENDGLGVRLFLAAGRVWNKIIGLATPDSYWQVETGNAVAAVRGTAFGVEYLPGKSFFIGVENEVAIDAADPDNHEVILNNTAIVGPGEMLEITDELIEDLKNNRLRLDAQVMPLGPGVKDRVWIQRAQFQDNAVDAQLNDLRAGGLPETEVRQILKTENYEEKTAIQERNTQVINPAVNDSDASATSADNAGASVDGNSPDDNAAGTDSDSINLLNVPVTNLNTDVKANETTAAPASSSVNPALLTAPIKLNTTVVQPIKITSSVTAGNIVL